VLGQSVSIVNATLIASVLVTVLSPGPIVAWYAAMLALEVDALRVGRSRGMAVRRASQRDVHRMLVQCVSISVMFGLLALLTFDNLGADGRTFMTAQLVAATSAGAIILATIPSVAVSWIVLHATWLAIAFASQGGRLYFLLTAQVSLFAVLLAVAAVLVGRNMDQRLRAEVRAAASEQTSRVLLSDFEASASDWLWETDDQGRITHVSERFADVAGLPADVISTMRMSDLVDLTPIAENIAEGQIFRNAVLTAHVGSAVRYWRVSGYERRSSSGSSLGWRGVASDVTDARNHAQTMEHLASHDALTGLANRTGYEDLLRTALAGTGGAMLAILDLDDFKDVNDTLGHAVGDQLLVSVAERLGRELGGLCDVARIGGDEFAFVIADPLSDLERLHVPDRAVAALREPFSVGDHLLDVRGSVGFAIETGRTDALGELFKSADLALYHAKGHGGDQASSYSDELAVAASDRADLLRDLRAAVASDQFELYFQPMVRTACLTTVGFEALIRWNSPCHGLVSPDRFIAVAEQSGLIRSIGRWALVKACEAAADWPAGIRVAVNIAASQLQDPEFAEIVESALSSAGLTPDRLELELTERSLVTASATVVTVLHRLRSRGVRISIDDFGTEYSSLRYLDSLPVDTLKIDRHFVLPLHRGEGAPFARLITRLAHELGLEVVAEGVESEEALGPLREMGCHLAQGYYFARPQPLELITFG
jgi:diguanylate cyclase (GGDEF)-like protein